MFLILSPIYVPFKNPDEYYMVTGGLFLLLVNIQFINVLPQTPQFRPSLDKGKRSTQIYDIKLDYLVLYLFKWQSQRLRHKYNPVKYFMQNTLILSKIN